MLDKEQSDNTTSNTENTDTTNVSEETLLEQQFNDLLLESNQDTQDEDFNCREECNTLTEEYLLSTYVKTTYWYYHLQYTDNKHLIISEQSPRHI